MKRKVRDCPIELYNTVLLIVAAKKFTRVCAYTTPLKRKVRGGPFEPYINVSLIVSVKKFTRQCPYTKTFEKKGQRLTLLMSY